MATTAIGTNEMKLTVHYTGPEVDRGRMSALDLGPAIFGLGEMVGEASRVIHGDAARVNLEVRADFEHASFGLEFLAVAPGGGIVGPLTLEDLANLATLLGFVGTATYGSVRGILALLKWQGRRKIESVTRVDDRVNITVAGEVQNISVVEYKIFINPVIRRGLKAFVAPLQREGVEGVTMQAGNHVPATVGKGELPAVVEAPLPEKEIDTTTSAAILEIVNPSLNERYKWRFAFGGGTIWAEIADPDFLADVAARAEQFGAGDALRADLEIRTTQAADGFHREYRVTHVHEHIQGERGEGQLPLIADSDLPPD